MALEMNVKFCKNSKCHCFNLINPKPKCKFGVVLFVNKVMHIFALKQLFSCCLNATHIQASTD